MDEVDRKREVRDKLGSDNKDEYEDDAEDKLDTALRLRIKRIVL
jgi:hypothetical protein